MSRRRPLSFFYPDWLHRSDAERLLDCTVFSVDVEEVIRVVYSRGNGVTTPYRRAAQYWTRDGEFLVEFDPNGHEQENA